MSNKDKTMDQGLLAELEALRRRVAELESDPENDQGVELALRESERTARVLIDAQHESAFLMDLDCNLVMLNETAARRMGGSPDELLGRNIADFMPPEIHQQRLALGREVVRTGKPVRSVDQRDGIWFDSTIYPVFDDTGEVVRWAVFARDITAQKVAEATIEKREAVLQAISFASRTLLEPGDFDTHLSEILRRLGEAQEVSRVWVLKTRPGPGNEVFAQLTHQWCAPDIELLMGRPDFQEFPQRASGYGRWVDLFSTGNAVHGRVAEFPEGERPLLEQVGIKALAAFPIMTGDSWWGAIGFDKNDDAVPYTTTEMDTLSTTAELLGAAVNRRRMERLLRLQRDVAIDLTASGGLGDALGKVLDTLAGFEWVDAAGIFMVDEESHVLQLLVHQGVPPEFEKIASPVEPGTAEHALLTSGLPRQLSLESTSPSPPWLLLHQHGFNSVICLPVWAEGRLAAVMILGSKHVDAVSSVNKNSFDIVCSQVGEHIARLRAEDAVRGSERKFRTLAEQSIIGIAVFRDFRFIFANEAFARIFGYDVETLVTMEPEIIQTHIHPEDREMVFSRMAARQAGRDVPQQYEFRIIRRDGTGGYVETSANRVIHGGRSAVQSVVTDITERKTAENALRQSEEKFRTLIEKSIQGLLVIQGGLIVLTNEAFASMVGYTVEELLNLPPGGLARTIHPDDREEIMARLRNRVEGGEEPRHYKARAMHKDGRAVWVDVVSDIIDYGGSRATQVLTVDITEQKKLEDRILQAHKMEAVGRLAGGVAHDFNNLLTAIRGYGKSLARKVEEQNPLREEVDEICFAADRAASLTRQLLAFSRKQVTRPELIQLNQVVIDMEGLLRRLIGRKIEVVTRLGKNVGLVRADRSQVEQILMNLVINSRDAMKGGGRLEIETELVELDEQMVSQSPGTVAGTFVRLSVTDSGVGLNESDLPHLFEPFFSTKGPGRGTGLGLSVVYGIVQQHGGLVEVESETGKWTRFDIHLPAAPADSEAAVATALRPDQMIGQGETLLVVEDEMGIRKLVETTLREANYRVVSAGTAEEALGLYESRRQPFDLLLSDVILPGLSGVQLVEELRDRGSDICVALTSGFTLEDEHRSYIDQHQISLLPKPFSSEELLAFIWPELKDNQS